MELVIPFIALGGLYMASKNNKKDEGFKVQRHEDLPNTDIRNKITRMSLSLK